MCGSDRFSDAHIGLVLPLIEFLTPSISARQRDARRFILGACGCRSWHRLIKARIVGAHGPQPQSSTHLNVMLSTSNAELPLTPAARVRRKPRFRSTRLSRSVGLGLQPPSAMQPHAVALKKYDNRLLIVFVFFILSPPKLGLESKPAKNKTVARTGPPSPSCHRQPLQRRCESSNHQSCKRNQQAVLQLS
jgi:hypothetical protein